MIPCFCGWCNYQHISPWILASQCGQSLEISGALLRREYHLPFHSIFSRLLSYLCVLKLSHQPSLTVQLLTPPWYISVPICVNHRCNFMIGLSDYIVECQITVFNPLNDTVQVVLNIGVVSGPISSLKCLKTFTSRSISERLDIRH